MIYLDNSATTQVCPEAAQAAVSVMTEFFGNPSSTHALGRDARTRLKQARAVIAASIGAQPDEIYFTAGGTEADNWALRSAAQANFRRGRHIISSLTEHDAILKTLSRLEHDGFEITRLQPGPDGAVSAADVAAALRPDTILVSLMLVNNETGAVTDIRAVSQAIKKSGAPALLHTDAVQGYLKMPINAAKLGADMISLSGHKVHAPKGSGALYIRKGVRLPALIDGGGQESGLRSGTEGMPGICAFAAAVSAAKADTGYMQRMDSLRKLAMDTLREQLPDCVFIGGGAPHILCVSVPGYKSEVLLNYLDAKGICVSKGSACKKGARSHVLEAMQLPATVIDGAIRVSLCRFTTQDEILTSCAALKEACGSLYKTL